MKLIDIHNHVLPGIDDGAKSADESLEMLKQALAHNIEKIIVTPHYKQNVMENTKDFILSECEKLKSLASEHNINIDIYPGSEIFLSKDTASLLHQGNLMTMNETKYILVEVHRLTDYWLLDLKETLYNLSVDGYKVILAHPERYEITHKDANFIYELVSDGHYMQVNVNGLKPDHPSHKTVKKLLDHGLVHFIATDAHNLLRRPLLLHEGYAYIEKHYGKALADDLFYHNPLSVIENTPISLKSFKPIKKKRFFGL